MTLFHGSVQVIGVCWTAIPFFRWELIETTFFLSYQLYKNTKLDNYYNNENRNTIINLDDTKLKP